MKEDFWQKVIFEIWKVMIFYVSYFFYFLYKVQRRKKGQYIFISLVRFVAYLDIKTL